MLKLNGGDRDFLKGTHIASDDCVFDETQPGDECHSCIDLSERLEAADRTLATVRIESEEYCKQRDHWVSELEFIRTALIGLIPIILIIVILAIWGWIKWYVHS